MITQSEIHGARSLCRKWRGQGYRIGLVPTMGFFHAGHLALMQRARELADRVVVSLFVNPAQFGPNEDLARYPRDREGDLDKAAAAGVDLVFCPEAEEMYSTTHQTRVSVSSLSREFCGKDRPGHFQGVTTVVTKLFNIIQPDYAVFGEKDYQQLAIVRQMAEDLNFPVTIVGHPIVREPDGLAMSSRNAYLEEAERQAATVLYQAFCSIREAIETNRNPAVLQEALAQARARIAAEPLAELDYLELVDPVSLEREVEPRVHSRLLGAVKIGGKTRIIDNLAL